MALPSSCRCLVVVSSQTSQTPSGLDQHEPCGRHLPPTFRSRSARSSSAWCISAASSRRLADFPAHENDSPFRRASAIRCAPHSRIIWQIYGCLNS